MEPTPLQIAIIGHAASSAILAIALAYLWRLRTADRAPAYWSAALVLIALRQSLLLSTPDGIPPGTALAGLAGAFPSFLFYVGTLRFLDRPVPHWRMAALAGAMAALVIVASLDGQRYAPTLWAIVLLIAAIDLLTARVFWRGAREEAEPAYRVLAALFALRVLTDLLYPVLGVTPQGRAIYTIPIALLFAAIGVSLIIAAQRRLHLRSLRTQAELEKANQRFQDVVDTATAWIWEWDTERRIRFISPQVFDSLGIKPEQFIGRRFREVPGIARLDLSLAGADQVFTTDRPFRNVPIDVVTTAGRRVRISVTGKPIFDASGGHTGFRGITIDITKTSRVQATLDTVTAAVAGSVGPDYFRALVERLARDLGADMVLVGRCVEDGRVHAQAAWDDGAQLPEMEYALSGAPCAATLADGMLIVERDAARLYPDDSALAERGFQGYAGVALRGASGAAVGLIALMTKTVIADPELIRSVLTAVAPRAGAEMERQVAETALRDSEARFRALIDNMPIGFHLMDPAGRMVQHNRTLEGWSGVEPGRYIGQTIREAAGDRSPDFAEEIEAELQEVLATRQPVIRERDFVAFSGPSRPALISRFPIFDSAGQIAYVASFINDLTDVRHLEAQVREREALFHTVLDHMPIGFHLTDSDGRFVLVNRSLDQWSSLDRNKVLGRTLNEVADQLPYDPAPAVAALREVVESRRPAAHERFDRHADGHEHPVLVNRYPLFDSEGNVRFVATLITDLSEVKRLEAQVSEREELFGTILDHMPIGFHLTDLEGRFVMRNRTLNEWSGVDRLDALGRTHREIAYLRPYDPTQAEADLRQVAATGQPLTRERTDRHAGERDRPLLIHRYPVFDAHGKVRFVASLLADVTQVKHLEAQVAEREHLLRSVIDHMPIAFHLTDRDGRFVMRNRLTDAWTGVDSADALGKTHGDIAAHLPFDVPAVETELKSVVETRQPMVSERVNRTADGRKRLVLITRYPILDAAGEVRFVASAQTDLTDTRRLEQEVRERERLFRTVIDNTPMAFQITDPAGRLVLANRTLLDWGGHDESTLIGRTLRETGLDPAACDRIEKEIREVAATGETLSYEGEFTLLDGRSRPALIFRFPIASADGRTFVGTVAADLSELKQLQTRIAEREALFRAVIDNMPVAFYLTDAEGRVVQRNRMLESWGNVAQVGRRFTEMDVDEQASELALVDEEIRQVRETGQTLVRERVDLVKGGRQRPVLVCRFPIFGPDDKVSLVASMVTDVSDLKRLEGQVRQSEARLQRVVAALDRSQKGVVVEDAGNRPIYINRTAGELMGNESSAVAMLERAGIGSEFEAHGAWSGEVIHRTRSGNDAILQASISRLPDGGSVTLLDDATERLERERRQVALERQVQEAQKMDAVGQLAGGIAHDFNDLIGAILGFARFIAEDTEEKSPIHGYAERILSASQRARDLIRQILAFSRRENAPRQPAALSRLVEESAQLLRATVPATLDIEVRNDFAEAWSIVNQTQITQILVNLCLNAADAMEGQPGALTLALERLPDVDPRLRWLLASGPGSLPRVDAATDPDQPSRCFVGALRTGVPYLVLSVRDEGPGIPAEQLAKIFDPFFTTKPRGRGTGLGLSVVQRLVVAHDGAIVVTTRLGAGTTFDIILPVSGRSSRDNADALNRDDPSASRPPADSARARVLVVDDDQHFGDMVSTALDRAGYEVGVCNRPREAIEVFGQGQERWDVLVTDQTMPEMSGLELIGRLKTLHPGLRCILCTGYAVGGLNAVSARAGGADAFFNKPVDVEALMTAIAGLTAPDTVG